LQREAERILVADVYPAYRDLLKYLEQTYLGEARETIGQSAMPNGKKWYAYNARYHTTTDLTPKEIHEIGLAEVARIRGEMEKIIRDLGFDGSFTEFAEFLRTDPQFYFDTQEEFLAAYRAICKRADPELVRLFGRLPRLPYGVKPVPDYMDMSAPTAYYEPGSLAAGRPGAFFANTYDLATRPGWEMEVLSLHEAVPGHHLQIALAQELEGTHDLLKYNFYTAFVEGWGLYAESLGGEMGFYQSPYSKFGRLTYEIWRAIRLVVDTGIHALGWSREQAIDFFKQNAPKTEHDIVVEVDRYIVWPGQALAYKIGELKIQELREHAQRRLGSTFDVRSFHDQVLLRGAMPLDVLEQRIHDWVERIRQQNLKPRGA
jgi:prolyl oligopeptidase